MRFALKAPNFSNRRRYYPKGHNGRRPFPLGVMLRIHCMQLFYNLSDPAMEDALYEIESMRRFAGLRPSIRLPDETTILNFRHFLERRKLGRKLFDEINGYLSESHVSTGWIFGPPDRSEIPADVG